MALVSGVAALSAACSVDKKQLSENEDASVDAPVADAIEQDALSADAPVADAADVDAPAVDGATLDSALVDGATADACTSDCLVFAEDFEAYPTVGGLGSLGGWTSTATLPIRTASLPISSPLTKVADGRTDPGHRMVASAYRPVTLVGGRIYELSFLAYCVGAQGTPQPESSGSYVYLGNAAGSRRVGWFCNGSVDPSRWEFDARPIVGGTNPDSHVGGFDRPVRMSIVVDRVLNEVYGTYDFGTGTVETSHVPVSAAELTALQTIGFLFDYTSPPAVPGAAGYLGGEFDNLRLSETTP